MGRGGAATLTGEAACVVELGDTGKPTDDLRGSCLCGFSCPVPGRVGPPLLSEVADETDDAEDDEETEDIEELEVVRFIGGRYRGILDGSGFGAPTSFAAAFSCAFLAWWARSASMSSMTMPVWRYVI